MRLLANSSNSVELPQGQYRAKPLAIREGVTTRLYAVDLSGSKWGATRTFVSLFWRPMENQICRVCGEDKPLSEYSYRKDNRKYRTNCKSCRSIENIPRLYGISATDYREMLTKQQHQCAICSKTAEEVNHTYRRLVVDHCHTTGKVRGLLCALCNQALGLLGDDREAVYKAYRYLGSS